MISRTLRARFAELAAAFPVVTLTGPRQSGKTTLCRASFPEKPYLSLERPDVRAFARQDPAGFLAAHPEGAVLDEIQRAPELASWLQPLVDEDPAPGRWILTGSQNLALTQATTQSLAGRTALLDLLPFDLGELRATTHGADPLIEVLWRGGYPAIFDRGLSPPDWLGAYQRTYVERDVRQLLAVGDLEPFQTFLGLCAGRSGTLLNLSGLGRDAGISHNTARAWLSVLEASYLTFRLRPWHRNLGKRLVRSPKLYFWDTGLMCHLLGIDAPAQLQHHPLRGAVFETWVVSEVLKWHLHRGRRPRVWFYRDQRGNEADLLVETEGHLLAIEAKSGATVPSHPFESLTRVGGLWLAAGERAPRRALVYGGEARQVRSGGLVLPWRELDGLWSPPLSG